MPVVRALVATIAVLVALSANASGSEAVSALSTKEACPVTVPTRTVPRDAGFSAAAFNYGGRHLRAHLGWRNGVLGAGTLPDGGSMATVEPDGSIYTKVGWWRGLSGELVITGRRLDASAPPLLASSSSIGYGPSGFQPSGLVFPTVGCWKVVGKLPRAKLAFVVKVTEIRQ
jgi:hypothetical protein